MRASAGAGTTTQQLYGKLAVEALPWRRYSPDEELLGSGQAPWCRARPAQPSVFP